MKITNKLFYFSILFNFINCITYVENKFVIVIPSYNNAKWYKKNLNSVINQNYKNFRVIYIDDKSNDNTAKLVEEYIKSSDKKIDFTLIKNKIRSLALKNIYDAVHTCKKNEIIVLLDGDDWFYDNNALTYLNKIYKNKNIWLTYGQCITYPDNKKGKAEEFPTHIRGYNNFRHYKWIMTHIQTFYAGLFQKIEKNDLLLNGKFFPMTYDQAIMYPMIEMSDKKFKCINKILYVYNKANSINDHKVNRNLQKLCGGIIRSKKKYKSINSF